MIHSSDDPVRSGQETGVIVIAQFVHGAHEGRILETRHLVHHDAEEGRAVLIQIIPGLVSN